MSAQENSQLPVAYSSQTSALVLEPESMKAIMGMAEMMAGGKATVPDHLRNSADCMAVIMQAMQWGMNPFAVAQKTHIVNGKLGYEAQLVNAVVMASGAIQGRFHYEYQGDGEAMQCQVGAVIRGETTVTWGEWLALKSVTTRNSPLWKTNPKQQIGYLQVKNWSRAYAPGAILGVYSTDELEPQGDAPAQIKPDPYRDIPPGYPEVDFDKNLPAWKKAIESGKKSPDDIIATVSTKGVLSDEQKSKIKAIHMPAAETVIEGVKS